MPEIITALPKRECRRCNCYTDFQILTLSIEQRPIKSQRNLLFSLGGWTLQRSIIRKLQHSLSKHWDMSIEKLPIRLPIWGLFTLDVEILHKQRYSYDKLWRFGNICLAMIIQK